METRSAIARYREKHELTLKAFGTLFGVDQSTALRWERGHNLTAKRLAEISSVTGIPISELVAPAAPIEAAE